MSLKNFKSLFFLCCFISLLTEGYCQNKIDSLQHWLETAKDDTLKVDALLSLSREYMLVGKFPSAGEVVKNARKLALQIDFTRGVGSSYIFLGHTFSRTGQYDSGLLYYNKALSIFQRINNISYQADCHLFLGQVHDYKAQYSKALEEYKIALSLAEASSAKTTMVMIYNSIGITYMNLGSYDLAVNYYIQGEKAAAELKDRRFYANILNNLGVVYQNTGNYEEALKNFLLYYDEMKLLKNKHFEAVALLNVGECYLFLRQPDVALQYFNKAEDLYKLSADKRGLSLTYANLGEVFKIKQAFAKSKLYYESALKIAREIKSTEAELKALGGWSDLDLKTRSFNDARYHINTSVTIAKATNSKQYLENSYLFASRLDSAMGDYKQAYAWFKKYNHLKDSLFNEKKSKQILQMRELYESEKKDNEIKLLSEAKKREELEAESNMKLFNISLALFVVILLSVASWAFLKYRHSKIFKQQKEEVTKAYAELKLLMDKVEEQNRMLAQKNEKLEELSLEKDGLIGIVAHDLRSPLTRISGLAEILPLSGGLTEEQRIIIDNMKRVCRDGTLLIQDLLDINQYESKATLHVERLPLNRFVQQQLLNYQLLVEAKQLNMVFDTNIDDELKVLTEKTYLTRILDNLLTNAIKFSPAGKSIYVNIIQEEALAKLIVRDEGPGFHEKDMPHIFKKFRRLSAKPTGGEASTGLGLSIVKSLVEKINGSISVETKWGEGTAFVISLPYQHELKANLVL